MVRAYFYRNPNKDIYGFILKNHSDSIVCAAISALTINCVNSIEKFTSEKFSIDMNENGGYMKLLLPRIKNGEKNPKVKLLLNSLLLGLIGIKKDGNENIRIILSKDELA